MVSRSSEDRLHEMMDRVEGAKERIAQYKGERKQILQQLATLGVKTPEQAERLLKNLEKEVEKQTAALEKILTDLEKKYKW